MAASRACGSWSAVRTMAASVMPSAASRLTAVPVARRIFSGESSARLPRPARRMRGEVWRRTSCLSAPLNSLWVRRRRNGWNLAGSAGRSFSWQKRTRAGIL